MNDRPLDVNIRELSSDIQNFHTDCKHWWRYNSWRKNVLLVLSIGLALGATVAGAWGKPHLAATFSAIGAAVITAQNSFKFGDQTKMYGRMMTECDRLNRKLSYQTRAAADFDGVAQAFDELRNREGAEGEQKGGQPTTGASK